LLVEIGARRQMKEIDPLNFLKAVYMNADLPLSVRMRAAIELMPYSYPKLAVVAQVTDQGLAELLDRRLKKLAALQQNPTPQTTGGPQIETRPPMPRLADRRYRRM
jgi:hypothetical protein